MYTVVKLCKSNYKVYSRTITMYSTFNRIIITPLLSLHGIFVCFLEIRVNGIMFIVKNIYCRLMERI